MSIYGLYQKFMSAKMQNRVLLVGHDLNLLDADFPKNQLPEDFGGSVPRSNSSAFVKKIKKEAKRLENDFAYLSKLCNEGGSYTKLEEDSVTQDMARLQLEIEQASKQASEDKTETEL